MQKPEHLKIKGIDNAWADLSRWLVKGGASKDARWFQRDETEDTWKSVIECRIPFVEAIVIYFNGLIAMRFSLASVQTYQTSMNQFIQWADSSNAALTFDDNTIESAFLAFDEQCYRRAWVQKEITPATVYQYVHGAAQALSAILDRPKHRQLKFQSRVVKAYSPPRKTSVSRAAEKQHHGDTQALGYFCVDIGNALNIESIYGKLPIAATLLQPDGTERVFPIMPRGYQLALDGEIDNRSPDWAKKQCEPTNTIDRFRNSLVRIRILAEFVIFVYQTGINVTPALYIEREGLKYKSVGNGEWRVTCRKGRKHGAISFCIYSDYKPRLKKLIEFVDHFCPESPFLFPISTEVARRRGTITYDAIKYFTDLACVPWTPPRTTRNTRVNFLDRIVGDPEVSAEMAQHARETFKQNYERPSQQRAMTEITHFWNESPVSLISGGCDGDPEPVANIPSDVVQPDCINASGCLWCNKHRDIESEDYVWSLATFKHLKLIEAAQPIKREVPADRVVTRISEKLVSFRDLNKKSCNWVDEALLRIEEGVYHPTWKNLIAFWEAK